MNTIGIPQRSSTALMVIDVQERLMPVIHENKLLIEQINKLIRGAEILKVPLVVTEQYPRGLGHTCAEVNLPQNPGVIEKVCFSSMLSNEVSHRLKELKARSLIVCGVEAHICVLKTTLDALQAGYEVYMVADAVSSRTAANKQLALERMGQAGAYIVSLEMILFQLMDVAGTDEFKAISQLIK